MKQIRDIEVSLGDQDAIAIFDNPMFHGKTKHFNINFFFREKCRRMEK